MNEITDQIKVFVAIIGASIAALVGIWARHATDPVGFSWRRLVTEIPVAIMCGIIAGAAGQYFGLAPLVSYGIASSAAYISPPIVFAIIRKKVENDDGKAQ